MIQERQKILIVDDDIVSRTLFKDVLEKDYLVYSAKNADSALQITENIIPDIMLIDVIMPGKDGFKLTEVLKDNKKTSRVPIIFITALKDDLDEKKGLRLGAVDYITKPLNITLAKARIKNHLELEKYRKDLDQMLKKRTEEIENIKEALIAAMGIMAEYRDNETGKHIQRTKYYYKCMAVELSKKFSEKFDEDTIDLLSQSASLHDIGKVGIKDEILRKPGKLTKKEFKQIKRHTIIGKDIINETEKFLGQSKFLRFAREIAEYHHERYDGTGYPYGLKGDEIPLSAQIMSIIDVYDALISKRPYKPAFSHEKAVKIITIGDNRTKPTHFSPDILNAFKRVQEKFKIISSKFKDKNDICS